MTAQQRASRAEREFDWVGLADPTAEEMELVRTQFGLHPLAVEDALNPNQMPKVEIYGQQLFIIARTAAIEEGENIAYGQTAIFLGRNFIVTVRIGSTRAHNTAARPAGERCRTAGRRAGLCRPCDPRFHGRRLSADPGEVRGKRPGDGRARDRRLSPNHSTIRRIFRLRRQFRRFQRIIGPMEEVCERLASTELPVIDPGARIWFRDVLDHVRRTLVRMNGLRDTLASIVETASAARTAPPGRDDPATGRLGRDPGRADRDCRDLRDELRYMPELESQWGYPAVWGVILGICGGLWLRFRRIGWL